MPPKLNESAKQKYERQKALSRERQRKRRRNLMQEQIEKKRKYDRDRIKKLKEENKLKRIKDMTEREKRKIRKYWRKSNLKRKQRKSELERAAENTPPDSLDELNSTAEESTKKIRGRKNVRKDRAKAYRTISKQRKEIEELEKKLRKYKKRLSRAKAKLNPKNSSPSPRKQLQSLVGVQKVSPAVKKQLFVGLALKKQLESQVKKVSGKKKSIQIIRKSIGNEIIKKYRVQNQVYKILPYKTNRLLSKNNELGRYSRKKRVGIRTQQSQKLISFFEEDTVSRMCPGKKDWVKVGNTKKQRRVLLDSMKNLHKRYKEENKTSISLMSFSRAKPKWVQPPKNSDRDTCACVKHKNMNLVVTCLKAVKVIEEKNTNEVIQSTVCSIKDENCMLNKCYKCRNKTIKFVYDNDFKVKLYRWTNIKEERIIKGQKKLVKKTMKVKLVKMVFEIRKQFDKELLEFKKHVHYANKQASTIKSKIDSLGENELVFRFDFSENYVAKCSKEIQSTHFGASKVQLSLHTGLRYSAEGIQIYSFCTVSDNLQHQSHAVWSHLKPILLRSASQFPGTKVIHFISDSPSNQYRNRMNVYLFKRISQEIFPNITMMTWNFTEAGHGKGPMDGIGGTLKREADRMVMHGQDITNASDFVRAHVKSSIFIQEIKPEEVSEFQNEVQKINVAPIKGISKARQVTINVKGKTNANLLSCFDPDCIKRDRCQHYHLFEVTPVLRIEDVYSSSEDGEDEPSNPDLDIEHVPTGQDERQQRIDNVKNGDFILVEIEVTQKSKSLQFVAVCQSDLISDEIEVMFMKSSKKDNLIFYPNENDVSYVCLDQIASVLPYPKIIMKGKRRFYKFLKSPFN